MSTNNTDQNCTRIVALMFLITVFIWTSTIYNFYSNTQYKKKSEEFHKNTSSIMDMYYICGLEYRLRYPENVLTKENFSCKVAPILNEIDNRPFSEWILSEDNFLKKYLDEWRNGAKKNGLLFKDINGNDILVRDSGDSSLEIVCVGGDKCINTEDDFSVIFPSSLTKR